MDSTKASKNSKPAFNWTGVLWALAIWLLVSLMLQRWSNEPESQILAYSTFKEYASQGRIVEITMRGHGVTGTMRSRAHRDDGVSKAENTGDQNAQTGGPDPTPFATRIPAVDDPGLMALLESQDIELRAEADTEPWLLRLLAGLLPWLLIIGLFVYSSRRLHQRMQGEGGLLGFGKSRAKRFKQSTEEKGYDDVAGLENTKKELQEIVAYLQDPSRFQALGGHLPKGILLVGPPGVGKTLMAQATAGEAHVPFFSISGSEFIEMFVGVGASRVRDMFAQAKQSAPALIFIDELDSIGRARGTGLGGGHDEREQTLNQILSEMDGFDSGEAVVVLAATNRPDVLDPALVRPGRFDRHIVLELPRKAARLGILQTHTRNVPLADGVDLEAVAVRTVGMSGAQLKNLVNEAALLAARKNKASVEAEDLDQARDKIIMGIKREETILDEEKEMIAYHEAGHALIAERMPEADSLQKVSIIPRGRALGVTEQLPVEERTAMRQSYLRDRIAVLLGGRAAERVVFDEVSTGAADDLKKATQLAKRMVCQWGMSEKLGAVAFQQSDAHPFLGREITEAPDYSEHTARIIDEEVATMINRLEEKVFGVLTQNRTVLDRTADALLKHETLTREDLNRILDTDNEG